MNLSTESYEVIFHFQLLSRNHDINESRDLNKTTFKEMIHSTHDRLAEPHVRVEPKLSLKLSFSLKQGFPNWSVC